MPDASLAPLATTDSAPTPLRLQRFTTTYDISQDRISLVGQGSDGSPVHTLWLTQRLLRRLLPTLWQWLERHDTPQTDLGTAQAPITRASALHEMAQQAACAQLPGETEPPVTPGLFSPQWLVCSVQLRASAQGVELLLNNAQDDNAALPMDYACAQLAFTAQPLRQWLDILRQLHQQADWPLDQWPQWLTAATGGPQNTGRPVLH